MLFVYYSPCIHILFSKVDLRVYCWKSHRWWKLQCFKVQYRLWSQSKIKRISHLQSPDEVLFPFGDPDGTFRRTKDAIIPDRFSFLTFSGKKRGQNAFEMNAKLTPYLRLPVLIRFHHEANHPLVPWLKLINYAKLTFIGMFRMNFWWQRETHFDTNALILLNKWKISRNKISIYVTIIWLTYVIPVWSDNY